MTYKEDMNIKNICLYDTGWQMNKVSVILKKLDRRDSFHLTSYNINI